MKKVILFFIILNISLVIGFKQLQTIFFNLNFSWYWSYLLPYLIIAFTTLVCAYFLIVASLKNKTKLVLMLVTLIIPSIGFGLHPIYAGDYTAQESQIIVNKLPSNQQNAQNGLVLISLSNCKYCLKAIEELKIIKKRVPKATINVAVLTTNPKAIEYYNAVSNNQFNVFMIDSLALQSWSELSPNGQFPCYLYLKNSKIIKKWSGQQFGYTAKDFVEQNK